MQVTCLSEYHYMRCPAFVDMHSPTDPRLTLLLSEVPVTTKLEAAARL